MVERHENGLPPSLRDVTRLLRESPPPSDVWRQRLLRAIEAAPRPAQSAQPRRWSMRPLTALVAGIVCLLVGAGAMALVQRETTAENGVSQVRFALVAPAASQVSIVGDFNGWNPTALPLRRSADGRTWEVTIPLAPGRYTYSFVVDGALARDPAAPQAVDADFGSVNSVVMVKGS